jgi:uncharacterized protein (UPF0147 family)
MILFTRRTNSKSKSWVGKMERDRSQFIEHLSERLGVDFESAKQIVEYFDAHKIINRRSPEKAMIRENYFIVLRENNGKVRETIMELAVRYDVSISFVSGIVYDRNVPLHKF